MKPNEIVKQKRKAPKTFKEQEYWRAVRMLVLKRDNNECQSCGARENLCIHHISYEHQGYELDHLEDLEVLCRKCHGNSHKETIGRSSDQVFDPMSIHWQITSSDWGLGGNLSDCLDILFDPRNCVRSSATRTLVEKICLEKGYISVDGWAIFYLTQQGESTLEF